MESSSGSPVVVQPAAAATAPPGDVVIEQSYQRQVTAVIAYQTSKAQRQWSTSICGCCENMSSCCYAFWCNPCIECGLARRMGECFCGPVLLRQAFVMSMRTKMRIEHGIQGSVLDDCCMSMWCSFCMTTQMDRELNHLGYAK